MTQDADLASHIVACVPSAEVCRIDSPSRLTLELERASVAWIVLDLDLPDGLALAAMQAILRGPRLYPVLAIGGDENPCDVFRLAQLGARAHLPKPVLAAALTRALNEMKSVPPDLTPHLRALVGKRPIQEVEEEVRRTMLSEALLRANGSRRQAARLLHVSRQLVQHMLKAK